MGGWHEELHDHDLPAATHEHWYGWVCRRRGNARTDTVTDRNDDAGLNSRINADTRRNSDARGNGDTGGHTRGDRDARSIAESERAVS